MSIRWAESAHRDLAVILRYFLEMQEQDVGQRLVDRLFAAAEMLARFPNAGRQGQVGGTRELVIPDQPYKLVYKVADAVEIVRVLHCRRNWP